MFPLTMGSLYNAVFDAVRNEPLAYSFFVSAVEEGLFPGLLSKGIGRIDLHDLSEGAAIQAVKWWLRDVAPIQTEAYSLTCLEIIPCCASPGRAGIPVMCTQHFSLS